MVAPNEEKLNKEVQELIKMNLERNKKERHHKIVIEYMAFIGMMLGFWFVCSTYGLKAVFLLIGMLLIFISYAIKKDDEKSIKNTKMGKS